MGTVTNRWHELSCLILLVFHCIADVYDGVVICLGAGVSELRELHQKLPLTYCRGAVVHLELPHEKL
jgi:hypothetical protein